MKRIAWVATIVLATLAVLFLLWEFRIGVWVFLFSLAAAATFRPPIKALTERGFSMRMALLLVYGGGLIFIGAVLTIVSLLLLTELEQAANAFAIQYERILVLWPEGAPWQQTVVTYLPESSVLFEQLLGGSSLSALPTMLDIMYSILQNMAYLIIIVFLGIYWTVDQARFERLWLSLLTVEYRGPAREIWRQIEMNVGAYARSELVQSLLAGFLLWIGYVVIGLQYPTLLALLGAIAWLIPILGTILVFVPVVILGLTGGFLWGLIAGAYTLLVFGIMEYVIEPRLFARRRFSSLLLVLVMVAFIDMIGLFGLIIAPPVAVSIQIFFSWLIQRRVPQMAGKTIPELVELQNRVAALETQLNGDQSASPTVTSMVDRLKKLLDEAADTRLVTSE